MISRKFCFKSEFKPNQLPSAERKDRAPAEAGVPFEAIGQLTFSNPGITNTSNPHYRRLDYESDYLRAGHNSTTHPREIRDNPAKEVDFVSDSLCRSIDGFKKTEETEWSDLLYKD